MRRGRLPACCCRHPHPVAGPDKTERPQRRPQRDHPINRHVTDRPPGRIADRDKPGRPRAPRPRPQPAARAPRPPEGPATKTISRLTREARHR
jgi:hypothetical protein